MKSIIVGTAGHIDHGKTSLVRALTGIDTDRLEEEKRRGISIDLGFAHKQISSALTLAFVDVPGHERFVRNMLAGATGMDLVLLVIAADESIRPQTREHFDICRLLGIERGVVVLTRCDLATPEWIELVKGEVQQFVAGSFLESAPVVAVSSRTGDGIPTLLETLTQQAALVTPRDGRGYFRLPMDRAFSMHGFGAVATGTMSQGELRVDQEIEILPGTMRARVRGLQVHGAGVAVARAGQRVAVNLAGVDAAAMQRGQVLTPPGVFGATLRLDARLRLLAQAPRLRDRSPLHFHSGAWEGEAELRLLDSKSLEAEESALVHLVLREPCLLLPGDRFVLRSFSPVHTIGGGIVLDIYPAQNKPRLSRLAARLQAWEAADAAGRLRLCVGEEAWGCDFRSLTARLGIHRARLQDLAQQAGLLIVNGGPHPWVLPQDALLRFRSAALALLKDHHAAHPLEAGMPKEELRQRVLGDAPMMLFVDLLARCPEIHSEQDRLRLPSHKVALHSDEDAAARRIESAFADGGLATPAVNEVLSASGVDAARARSILQLLLRDKRLVRVSQELVFHPAALQELRTRVAVHRGRSFGVADFKEWTGVSRKYAIPLLEFLDRERVTRRTGDTRIVL
jgi:selenocysteine-specific elongation factor